MNGKRILPLLAVLALGMLGSACTQKNTGDQPNASTAPTGLTRFLLFPNPVAMNTGGFETNTSAYADAYYRAIDPPDTNNVSAKDTLDKWKTANGFGSGTGAEQMAVFRDAKDLGYGRRMTGRMNTDGSVAFWVENYAVTPNGSGDYSSVLNVEAAIQRDTRWHVGTNAIEWSSTPCNAGDPADCSSSVKFAKFYNFSSKDGTRQVAVDLDGNGLKAMPGPCITCHGGRGDPLTPNEGNPSKPRFPLVENSLSRKRGDVQAHLHGMNVDSFGFSPDQPGFSKLDQQAKLKLFNQWILCTYPLAGAAAGAEDTCRVPAGPNEWQGTAAEVIKAWYGGPGMPQGNFNDLDTAGLPLFVPQNDWSGTASSIALYKEVVAPYCRTCHILRGTKNQDDLDFTTLAKFQSYADRIKAHVFERGTMPLAKIVYNDFWNSSAPTTLANFINPLLTLPQTVLDASGNALRPGRPIANPGPNRMARTNTPAILTGENSLFASSWRWEVTGGSGAIADPNNMITSFTPTAAGEAKVRLTVSNGTLSDSREIKIIADNAFPDPASIKFAHVKNVMQNVSHTTTEATGKCVECHKDVTVPAPVSTPPIWYTNFDRNGNGGAADLTDDAWFIKAVQGRVNLTEIEASPLLRKPSGNHHNGKMLLDVTDTVNGGLRDYSIIYSWILAGMPGGGVVANAGSDTISSPLTVTFTGVSPGPFNANVTLDGTGSIGTGTLNYLWTVTPPAGVGATFPLGAPSAITPTTTLTVQNVGTFVANLQVTDTLTNETATAQRTILVQETPLTFNMIVAGATAGSVPVAFTGSPATGTITVNVNQTNGSPVAGCTWQVGPTVANPLATGVSLGARNCSTATLNVTQAALNSQFQVSMTENGVQQTASSSQIFTVVASASNNPSGLAITPITTTLLGWSVNGTVGSTPIRTLAGATGVTLQASAAGPGTLTYSWAIQNQGTTGCTIPAGSSTLTTKLLSVTGVGTCTVTLTVANGIGTPTSLNSGVAISSSVVFSNVATLLGNPAGSGSNCTSCHNGTNAVPSWQTNGTVTGNNTLRTNLGTVINTVTPQSSLLLICPSNPGGSTSCSGMPSYSGFTNGTGTANYDVFLTWIINGRP